MSEPGRTEAVVHRSRWPGWIWAVPIVAVVIVGWLVLRYFVIDRGPEVTVTFLTAGGVEAGITKVRYKGMEVGEVEDAELSKDMSHVVMTLRMRGDVEKALTTGTRFWIVGAHISPGDLSALATIVSGPYIEMDPGPGKPARHFTGLEIPPAVRSETAGTRFMLHAARLGSLSEGSPVSYLGLQVGKVEGYRLVDNGRGVDIRVFVRAPYDKLVHAGTRFWNAGAVDISMAGRGIQAELAPLSALVWGAVAFATPPAAAAGPISRAGDRFELYVDENAAESAPIGPRVPYLVKFEGAVGDVSVGAAVTLRGFPVGQVTGVSLDYDEARDRLETPVVIGIEPARLRLRGVAAPVGGDWTPAVNRALDQMIREGLRARLARSMPVVGGEIVELAFVPDAPPAKLILGGAHPEIPTAPSADLGRLATRAGEIMARLDNLPLPQIADGLRRTVDRLDALVSSPEMADSVQHLDRALANLDQVSRQARAKAGPLIDSLRATAAAAQQAVASADAVLGGAGGEQDKDIPEALYELANAARAIRALANYLDRHPEALLQGRSMDNR